MIVVFGSNVLDIFFHLADLPKRDTALFLDGHDEAPGGKGANQAVAAAKAGSEVRFFGALGKGGHGRQMLENLQEQGINTAGIAILDMPSGLATIFVDEADGTHKVVVSQGANLKAKQDTVPDNLLKPGTIVLVQGELPIEETEQLLVRAKSLGAKTVMNFAPATQALSYEILKSLDYIILNEYEADLVGQSQGINTSDKAAFAQELYERFKITTLVTLGGVGSLVCTGKELLMVPPLKIKPVDTIGAGDAYTGYFCAALDQGKDFETALKWASVAGSLACTKVGAQTALPLQGEVEKRLPEIAIRRVTEPGVQSAPAQAPGKRGLA
jgi:ribokinase